MEDIKNIRLRRSDVESTEAFKSLGVILKKICLSGNNMKSLENGVNVCSNIGEKRWLEISNFSYNNQQIVLEIVEKLK